jgi:hypothetical protein
MHGLILVHIIISIRYNIESMNQFLKVRRSFSQLVLLFLELGAKAGFSTVFVHEGATPSLT